MVKSARSADLLAGTEPAEPFRFPAPRRAPPLTARRFAALLAGKAAATATRLTGRGGGTSLPGMVARRIDPGILGALIG